MQANCKDWVLELVEAARAGAQPASGLRAHLSLCAHCRGRWDDECRLTSELRIVREAGLARRTSAVRQNQLLREFDAARRKSPRPLVPWLAAAAALLVLIGGVVELRRIHRPAQSQLAMLQENQLAMLQESIDADGEGFVDVPYAPPLATGEMVSVVRTRLQPTALARMGLEVDLASSSDIAADVVVGEDGFPRAVRFVDPVEIREN